MAPIEYGKRIKRNSRRIAPLASTWKTTHWNRIRKQIEKYLLFFRIDIIVVIIIIIVVRVALPNSRRISEIQMKRNYYNTNLVMSKWEWDCASWHVNFMCFKCRVRYLYEYEFDVRRAHETKWENYYSKPHDENARILCISIIAICWIYIITQGAARFLNNNRHSAHLHCRMAIRARGKRSTLCSGTASCTDHKHEFLLSFDSHMAVRPTCFLGVQARKRNEIHNPMCEWVVASRVVLPLWFTYTHS